MQRLLTTASIHHHFYFLDLLLFFLFANHLGDFTYDPPLLKRTL